MDRFFCHNTKRNGMGKGKIIGYWDETKYDVNYVISLL